MYRIININDEDYKLEFSIEASLYDQCIERITELMINLNSGDTESDIKRLLSGMGNIPQTALICFYAGLMEHHGHVGDGRVPNLSVAKKLAVSLIRDENNEEVNSWMDLLNICAQQMGEDGFFKLIGLSEMFGNETPEEVIKVKKTPTDHKKKTTKVSEK